MGGRLGVGSFSDLRTFPGKKLRGILKDSCDLDRGEEGKRSGKGK